MAANSLSPPMSNNDENLENIGVNLTSNEMATEKDTSSSIFVKEIVDSEDTVIEDSFSTPEIKSGGSIRNKENENGNS